MVPILGESDVTATIGANGVDGVTGSRRVDKDCRFIDPLTTGVSRIAGSTELIVGDEEASGVGLELFMTGGELPSC